MADTPSHDQSVDHHYVIHYPQHEPREHDPHKPDFEEYRRRRKAAGTYYCDFAAQHRGGDTSECDLTKPLECHHKIIEFALANGVDLALLEPDYPGVSKQGIGAWIDTAPNLEMLCAFHHRGHGGKHILSVSDYEAELYIRQLIS